MSDIFPAPIASRDRLAECQARAAADRLQAESMDTSNGRRKFEESAASWDQRAALLGRLDASFNKRERLDAEARRFQSAVEADGRGEGESGPMGPRRPVDAQPEVMRPGGAPPSGGQG